MKKLYTLSLFIFYFIIPAALRAQTWKPLGPDENDNPSTSSPGFTNITISPDGTPYIAYIEERYGNKLTVKKFDGTKWVVVGQPGFTEGYYASDIGLVFAPDGTPYVSYASIIQGQNYLNINVRKLSGNTWVSYNYPIGTGIGSSLSFAPDGTPYLAYSNSFGAGLSIKKISTIWDYVGDTTNISGSVVNSSKIIVASDGTPYVAYAASGNQNKAAVKKFVNGIWQYVGSTGFTNAGAANVSMALATDGSIYVAYTDSTIGQKVMVQQFKNGTWINTNAAGLSVGGSSSLSLALAPDQTPYLLFSDGGNGGRAIVKKLSGGTWVNVGPNGISSSMTQLDHIAINANGVPYIIYRDVVSNSRIRVKMFTGNQWTDVGQGGVTAEPSSLLSLKVTNTNAMYVAFRDPANNDRASVKQYRSGSWQYVGVAGSITKASPINLDMDIARDGTPYVIYKDSAFGVVKKYSGTAWSQVGGTISSGAGVNSLKMAIAPDGTPYAAYSDDNYAGQVTVQKYSGSAWGIVGQPKFSTNLASNINIAVDQNNTPIVGYTDVVTTKANVKVYSAGSWASLGAADFSPSGANDLTMTLAPDGTPYVAYYDTQKGKIAVEAYSNSSWVFIGGPAASDSSAQAPRLIFDQNGQLYLSFLKRRTLSNYATVRKLSQGQWVDAGNDSMMPWNGTENSLAVTPTGDLIYAYLNPQLFVRTKSSDSLAVAPVITSCTPAYGGTGTFATITGFNFSKATAVKFGTTPAASFTVVSPTQITAVVGSGASGLVSVTTSYGTGTFDNYVFSAAPPIITSFSPQSGNVGSSVTINGKYFGSSPTNNIVYFGPVTAQVISGNDSTLVVKVPAGSTYAPITVTTRQLTAYSSGFFDVTFKSKTTFDASSFTKKNFATIPTPSGLLISDVDNDGKPDILATAYGNTNFSIFQNTSGVNAISLVSQTGVGTGGYAITGTDLDGDGKIDIATTQVSQTGNARNKSTLGSLSFGGAEYYQTTKYPFDISSGDVDGDGQPDLITSSNQALVLSILRNSSSQKDYTYFEGEFDISPLDAFPQSVTLADLDGDGKPEVITVMPNYAALDGTGNIVIFKNTSTAHKISFTKAGQFPTSKSPGKPVVADIDNDGKPDIVITNSGSNTVSVFQNQTTSTISFAAKVDFATGTQPSAVCIADLDGDGKPDISVTNSSSNTVSVFKNTSAVGNIALATNVDFSTGKNPSNIMAGDIDGDGVPDLIVTNYADNTISVLRNNMLIKTIDVITFNALPNATYGDADITLTATSTDLINPISFTSSDNTIVSILPGGKAHLLKPGVVTITAQQTNGTAAAATQILKVLPAIPTITANGPLTFVQGNSVVLTSSTDPGYTYQWAKNGLDISGATNSSFTATQTGSYTVTVSLNSESNISAKTAVTVQSNSTPPAITTSGNLSDLTTTYGTPSSSTNFSVSGTNLTTGVTVTAPPAFEVSSDNVSFGNQITVGSTGTLTSTVIYIRLAASTSVGSYVGNISLTSGTASVDIPMVYSLVTLPSDNYKITINSATCRGSDNGSINITASKSLNYIAKINGNGLTTTYPFTTSVDINNLAAGPYSVCITVAGQPSYQQCYDISITEPKDLSVYSTINNANNTVSLALSGGTQYNIELNGRQYNTSDNSITLPLAQGNNDLTITTDKLCQGIIQKLINISGIMAPYPNPFQNTLSLNLGDKIINNVAVEIQNVTDGKLVYAEQFVNQSGVLKLDISNLKAGVYVLQLSMDNSQKVFKILKNEK